jgi:D-3-phosphoglycerate dehydrogenase
MRILVVDPIDADALAQLRSRFDVQVRLRPSGRQLLDLVPDVEVIVFRSGVTLSAAVFDRAARLKVVGRAGTGVDNIDLAAATRTGVCVFNVPGQSAGSVAELAFGLMLAAMRNIPCADRKVRAGVWEKASLMGSELQGRTLGVIGFGDVGSRIARIAAGFSMKVLASVAHPSPQRSEDLAGRGCLLVGLAELLALSDVVCLAVPLTEDTRGLIGSAALKSMKPSAFLVNVSRGGVVDEGALVAALRDRTIAGAGLDVHAEEAGAPPFSGLDRVVLTPHLGAMTSAAQRAVGRGLVEGITAALEGRDVPNRVC